MKTTIISIEQLRRSNPSSAVHYLDKLMITNRIEDIDRFKSPCRINAVTMLVCLSGTIEISINLRVYTVTENMILVNLPEDILQIRRSNSLEAYVVLISSDFLDELAIDIRKRSDFFLAVRKDAQCIATYEEIASMRPYYNLLRDNILTQRSSAADIIHSLARAFAYTTISLKDKYSASILSSRTQEAGRNEQLFSSFMALVKIHHVHERTVSFYASKMCLTPNYLSGIIKQYSGKSASQWIDRYVILEAKIMLHDTALSVKQIAYQLNFANQSTFGKYFKSAVGLSPRQYRKNL